MSETEDLLERLQSWFGRVEAVQIAVSGGVDSMTLGLLAGRIPDCPARMLHARSPAVPPEATARVKRVADREGWDLEILDAGEMEDEAYIANPYRRCFHCKSHLYSAMAKAGAGTLLSGTNRDDLDDFRPGLQAAELYRVRHPFVECGVDKSGVRRICRRLGYPDLAELPASPCLSSRIQTGIRIQPAVLGFVDRVESLLRRELPAQVVRCRVQSARIAVQLEPAVLSHLSQEAMTDWTRRIRALADPLRLPASIRFEPYRMGSAFVADHSDS